MMVVVVLVGVAVGIMSAMFGVGGGILMVPFIVTVLDKSQHLAEGTSLAVIVPTAIAGVIAHRKRGYVSTSAGLTIATLGIAGSYAGARLALSIDAEVLQQFFGAFTVLVGIRLIYDGYRKKNAAEG